MKRRFIFTMIILLIFSYTSISGYEYHMEIQNIEHLLNERINIINGFLYGCKDMNILEEKLNKIESENLLANDLEILYKVIDCPTDYELAMSVKVDKINKVTDKDGKISINADLNWFMSGYDGEFNLIKNYNIKCIQVDKQYFLTSMTLQN